MVKQMIQKDQNKHEIMLKVHSVFIPHHRGNTLEKCRIIQIVQNQVARQDKVEIVQEIMVEISEEIEIVILTIEDINII